MPSIVVNVTLLADIPTPCGAGGERGLAMLQQVIEQWSNRGLDTGEHNVLFSCAVTRALRRELRELTTSLSSLSAPAMRSGRST